jgi:hypothetical protein
VNIVILPVSSWTQLMKTTRILCKKLGIFKKDLKKVHVAPIYFFLYIQSAIMLWVAIFTAWVWRYSVSQYRDFVGNRLNVKIVITSSRCRPVVAKPKKADNCSFIIKRDGWLYCFDRLVLAFDVFRVWNYLKIKKNEKKSDFWWRLRNGKSAF